MQIINGYAAPWASRDGVFGTYVSKVLFNAAATRQTIAASPCLYFYGDSILSGAGATDPSVDSVVPLVIPSFTGSVYNDAYDSRTLTHDAATAGTRTAFAARIATFSPTIIWIQIGTNDYSTATLSAADFETAYADLLDKLHTALPSAVIHAQTMIIRATETANSFGDTTDAYRTAISNARIDPLRILQPGGRQNDHAGY